MDMGLLSDMLRHAIVWLKKCPTHHRLQVLIKCPWPEEMSLKEFKAEAARHGKRN